MGDPDGDDVLHGGDAGVQPEAPDEPSGTFVQSGGVSLNVDVFVVVLRKILNCLIQFLLHPAAELVGTVDLAIHNNEKLMQKHRKKLLVMRSAQLQLLDHSPEYLLIFRRISGIKHMAGQWNMIFL